ncbi:MAG: hypothetical protein ABEH43_00810 [Flavobacteriales bacterium]
MDAKENLYYALGQLAYAVAKVDNKVQKEEKKKFHDIVEAEINNDNLDFNISNIIFQIMEKDHSDLDKSYDWAIQAMRLGSHYMDDIRKAEFLAVLKQVAKAFPPETVDEKELIERFKKDLDGLDDVKTPGE